MIANQNPYVGEECLCGMINFYISNTTENGNQYFQVHYSLFCPEKFASQEETLCSFDDWDSANDYMQYEMQTSGHVKCCVIGDNITTHCQNNFYGAMGFWFIVLGLAIPLSIWFSSYYIIYESGLFKESGPIRETVEVEMQQVPTESDELMSSVN